LGFFFYFSDVEQELSIKINKKYQKQLYENGDSTYHYSSKLIHRDKILLYIWIQQLHPKSSVAFILYGSYSKTK